MARPDADAATDLHPPAHGIADALSNAAFKVTIDLPADLPRVAVPGSTVEAVLSTLMENSRQAGARTVVVTARANGKIVTLAVADDGPGVPAADRDRLFEPFFTTHRADGGAGLGLPIARSLVEAHGGHILIADPATGARFEVTLPQLGRDAPEA